ncbi:hypothetical protein I4U23_015595 [Adineta vaga]|nr:hypothetical protein I4U23_015595 [Adineta vaga]
MIIHQSETGFVECKQEADIRLCSNTHCSSISTIHAGDRYPADCWVKGENVQIGETNDNKWYQINLKQGGIGYVSSFYCYGNLSHC